MIAPWKIMFKKLNNFLCIEVTGGQFTEKEWKQRTVEDCGELSYKQLGFRFLGEEQNRQRHSYKVGM